MATPYRPLRPAPLADGQPLLPPEEPSSKRGDRAALACEPCRKKRRKCSGKRPQCSECSKRMLRCFYEAKPGQTRMASLKEDNESMKRDLDTMVELYWYMQSKSREEAEEALSAIQSGSRPREVLETIRDRTGSNVATPQSGSARGTEPPNETRTVTGRSSTSSSSRSVLVSSQDVQTPTETPVTESPSGEAFALSALSRTIDSLGKGSQAFFTCTGCIFHIYDQHDAEKQFSDLRPYLENSRQSWLELVSQGTLPSHLKPALCSLCIMAAVGLQYTKNPIPALGFVSSSSDGSYEFVNVFYESARHLLEAVIEIDILEAMRVCAALTVFNTIGHATVAMVYVDMGINFALSIGSGLQFRPERISDSSWIKHKRVARTLVTLRSWLVSTLGYIHGDHPGLQSGTRWLVDSNNLTANETIQQELNKVVQIEANLLRTLDSFQMIAPGLLSSTRRDLIQWHEQLPGWMQLSALLELRGEDVVIRRTVFLVHVFFLSASMLLGRLAHGASNIEKTISSPRYDIEEVRIATADGVQSARTTSRILQLQMDEKAIFQRCWNCEFAAYVSCLTLLHSVAQMQLHDYSQKAWKEELSHARSCLDVLEHCAKADTVAAHFAEITRAHYTTLSAQIQLIDDIDVFETPTDFDYLFSIPQNSPAHLAQTAHNLLKNISCPFGTPSNLQDEGTLKAGLGAHVTMLFNNSPPQDSRPRSAVETAFSNMPMGQFVGSTQPHGWDMFLDFNTL